MLNKFAAFVLISLISFGAIGSEKTGVITGRVIEKGTDTPLQYATVTVQNKEKKVLAGSVTGEDGNFIIERIDNVECSLKVSFIGFRDTVLTARLNDSVKTVNLGIISLSSNASILKSAVVTSKIPLIEQKIDKIIFNVSEAVSTQGNNAFELIRKAPGVSIDFNGNILLNGSSAQVWLDGRASNMSGQQLELLLSGTDAATIDKIEIMSHPSSKYDASGSGGIINIKTKRNFFSGLNGYIKAGYSVSPYYSKNYDGFDATVNLNYRGDKSNTSLTYSPRFSDRFQNQVSSTEFGENVVLEGRTKTDMLWKFHNLRFTNDIYLSKKSTLGVIIQMFNRKSTKWSDDFLTGNTLFNSGNITEKTYTSINDDNSSKTISANLNYTYTISKGQELTLNADYGRYNTMGESFQENFFTDADGNPIKAPNVFRSSSDQFIDIISARADYEQMFKNNYRLEAGAKWAVSITDNDLLREDRIDNIWTPNQYLSSNFGYRENIYASYITLSRQLGRKWSVKAGLRAELTDSHGDWISTDTTTNKKYIDLFPTIFIGYNPKSDLRLGLSYSKRINRPNYNQLNPFRIYVDAYSSLEGNPQLMPQYGHMISLSLGFKRHISLRLFGQLTNGVIAEKPEFNIQTGEKLLKYENFGKQEYYGAAFSLSELPIKKWFIINANVNVMGMFNSNEDYESKSVTVNGNLNSTFLLPRNFKIELDGMLRSGMTFGYFKMKPSGNLNIGIMKSLFENKGTVSINISDLLNTRGENVKLNSDMMDSYYIKTKFNSRQVTLSFQYRFGKSKSTKARKVGLNEEAVRTGISN